MINSIKIQVNFSQNTEFGIYQDALYFSQEDFANLTEEQLLVLQNERVNNWVQIIKDSQQVQENTEDVPIDPITEVLEPEVI
jgi:hypothetical protein